MTVVELVGVVCRKKLIFPFPLPNLTYCAAGKNQPFATDVVKWNRTKNVLVSVPGCKLGEQRWAKSVPSFPTSLEKYLIMAMARLSEVCGRAGLMRSRDVLLPMGRSCHYLNSILSTFRSQGSV